MRSDLDHKFNERRGTRHSDKYPRSNKKLKKFRSKQNGALTEIDSGPKRESMRIAHSVAEHYKNYDRRNWSIIRRVLRANVGRPWDEVFSEICETVDNRTHEGHELRWWVENMYVETHCQMIDGKIYSDRGLSMVNHWGRCEEFYVHPETNLLCCSKYVPWSQKKPEEVRPKILELDGNFYHEHEGLWYRVKLQTWKKIKIYCHFSKRYYSDYSNRAVCQDVFIGKQFYGKKYSWEGIVAVEKKYGKDKNGDYRFCVWKQAANSNEIARLKKKYQWD
jgi:hypothetical protein